MKEKMETHSICSIRRVNIYSNVLAMNVQSSSFQRTCYILPMTIKVNLQISKLC